jgi:protein-disulfide isomerase
MMPTKQIYTQLRTPLFVAVLFVTVLALVDGWAAVYFKVEVEAMKTELDALKKGQEAMQKEFAKLGTQRQRRPARSNFQPVDLNTIGAPDLGDRDAPVTLIEFTDYQCPYCRRHFQNTMPLLIKNYVDTGKLRYVIREVPVESSHPLASKAAQAALCAGDQSRYWEMHDKLFGHQGPLRPEDLKSHAQALGLNAAQFDQCLESGEKRERVQEDVKAGMQAGMRGTPTFFLGLTQAGEDGKVRAIEVIRGAKIYPDFAKLIDELLARIERETTVETTASYSGQ